MGVEKYEKKSDIGIHDVLKPCGSQATIDVFEKEKVEYLHIDVMDGEFVPNFGLGVDYIQRTAGTDEYSARSSSDDQRPGVQAAVDRHSQRGHRDDSL